ncbi:MAG: 16S rRNA (uracil(1498)-N(3))-methyltransferase [Phormidesmis sp.]
MIQRITIDVHQRQGLALSLKADQSHYLQRVLRLKKGDQFIAQNGRGQQWLAVLTEQPEQAQILKEVCSSGLVAPLHLISALPKGNSFDQVVRQSTELGMTHLYPVFTQRTLLKPSENKLSRWRRIAAEASEQSERITVPEVFEPMAFQSCLALLQAHLLPDNKNNLCYLCAARQPDSFHLLSQLQKDMASVDRASTLSSSVQLPSVTLAIGPEGGWTTDEITVAKSYGYKIVSLGSVILRAVTAPITALSLVTAARELLI